MDIVIAVLFLLGSILFAYLTFKENRKRDQDALDEEIDKDFVEEFGLPKSASTGLPTESMEKIVDWLEDDLKRDHSRSNVKNINEPEE